MMEAGKRKAAFALLQEPYVGAIKVMKAYGPARIFQNARCDGGTVKAAIAVYDPDIVATQCAHLTTNNIVVVKLQIGVRNVIAVSCYFEPDQPIEPYTRHVSRVARHFGASYMVVGGDANAKNPWWGGSALDERGEVVMGMLDELNLQVLNSGSTPTFDTIRGERHLTSFVDVTACGEDLFGLVDGWRVDTGLTSSDHNGILFEIKTGRANSVIVTRTTRKYNTKKANWDNFNEKLTQLKIENNLNIAKINSITNRHDLDQFINNVESIVTSACDNSIPKLKPIQKLSVPWWSGELEVLRKRVVTRKNRIRCARPSRRPAVVAEYLEAKQEYEVRAKQAQIKSWKEFCQKQNREGMWAGIYRVIRKTRKREEDLPLSKNGVELDPEASVAHLAEVFFPDDTGEDDEDHHRRLRILADNVRYPVGNPEPEFTSAELKSAMVSFNPKKAPGADGFTADICARVIGEDPDLYLRVYNRCLELGHFPRAWKTATVVVLRKPGKADYSGAKSYRPIGLLPVMGKILEKMVVRRLMHHLVPRLSPRQYGFMPQRSTEDALCDLLAHVRGLLVKRRLIAMVSLDIEGAFDSAWWPAIKLRLAEEQCPGRLGGLLADYLRHRMVRVLYAGCEHTKGTSRGCIQGSIGGPILWNLLLDPLLKGLTEMGEYCQAFADDVVLVFSGDTAAEIQSRGNAALEYVRDWGVRNKLRFAPHKTNMMVLTNKLKYDVPHLSMGGVDIAAAKEIKLLGLVIDSKLTFSAHTAHVCEKALGVYKQLSKAARVSWGLHPEIIRTIYVATVEPIVCYAAGAWAPATSKLGVRRRLDAVQRSFAQKLCKAYRTVSLNAALVLAGVLPLDARIRENASLYLAKRGAPRPELADREIERPCRFVERPHPAAHIGRQFLRLESEDQVADMVDSAVQIYTDGSRLEGKVGASLSVWTGGAETKSLKLKLSDYCTVYQAELLAICKAAEMAAKGVGEGYAIISDSRSALEAVVNDDAPHPLAVKAREYLSRKSNQIKLYWVKAHVGIAGNERADELAKAAALAVKTKPVYDKFPVSFAKRLIRKETLGEWNRRYQEGLTASVTKVFFPDATLAFKTVRALQIDSVLTQVLTGHGGFSEYLTRFKCKEDPSCACDSVSSESILHLILDCPIFGRERFNIEGKINMNLKMENLHNIIKSKQINHEFLEYCKNVAKAVINKNK